MVDFSLEPLALFRGKYFAPPPLENHAPCVGTQLGMVIIFVYFVRCNKYVALHCELCDALWFAYVGEHSPTSGVNADDYHLESMTILYICNRTFAWDCGLINTDGNYAI